MWTENANKAKRIGDINVQAFSPYPKNPKIAKFFKEIGLADELGSGVRNMVKYTKIYSDGVPTFKENDIFTTIIPLNAPVNEPVNAPVNEPVNKPVNSNAPVNAPVNEPVKLVLAVIADNPNLSKEKIAEKIGMSRATVTRALAKLVEIGTIQRVGSDKSGHWEIVEDGV